MATRVARRLLRLVGEGAYPAAFVHHDDAEAAGVLDPGRGHGDVGVEGEMGVDHVAVVQGVDAAGIDHEDNVGVELGDEPAVAPQGIGVPVREAPLGPGEGVEDQQPALRAVQVPWSTVGQVVLERLRLVLLGHQASSIPLLAQLLSGKSMSR